jgi:hypothetical protein
MLVACAISHGHLLHVASMRMCELHMVVLCPAGVCLVTHKACRTCSKWCPELHLVCMDLAALR